MKKKPAIPSSKQYLDVLQKNRALEATYELFQIILEDLEFDDMAQRIANTISQTLGYETGVLALIDKSKKVLRRIAISETTGGKAALESLEVPFENMDIPLDDPNNYCIKAIKKNRQIVTHKLYNVVGPAISIENAKQVQQQMGITTSIITPITLKNKPIGVFIVSISKSEQDLSEYEKQMIEKYTDGVGIAISNANLYSDLETTTLKLKEANKMLKQLDKQKDEFISIASHELKTPISIAKNNLWMFRYASKNKFNKRQTHFLSELEGGLNRLQKIVNDLLDISRMQQGRLVLDISKCNIYDITLDALDNFEDLALKKNLEIIPPKPTNNELKLDSNKYIEVLENLLSNAIKYTDEGSITINIEKKKSEYRVSVTDTGPGIAKKDQQKIFKKFGRATQGLKINIPGASTGLGLYITKSYVDAMGGKIGFNSKIGKGTEFWFTIPKTPPKAKK